MNSCYVPECLIPLLGRDLLSKLNAQIVFEEGEPFLKIPESKTGEILMIQERIKEKEILQEVDLVVIPTVWETDKPGKSKLAPPVKIQLQEGARPVRIKQYPIKTEVRQEIKKLLTNFWSIKFLRNVNLNIILQFYQLGNLQVNIG